MMTKVVSEMIENFDIINIEYMEDGEETFDYPEQMLVSVETREDDHYTYTKDSIRVKIKSYIRRNFGNDVEVVDFLAFPVGSNIELGQEFEAETFEAREKKIGSIRIVKNPNFPSGTSLQAYIKTNRAELRKVFGNPNMGESGDGKAKGKEWNLVVGGKRVTIYDYREKDKKGTKYFNIGGDGKYGALLVAQALSIHRNERVYAKETVPRWLEDERRHERVQSIDDYPDLTYERAKEYEDNRRRYGAESDGFGEYTLPFVGGQRERLEDKIANQLVMLQRVALNKGNSDFLHDIFKEGLSGKPLRKMTDAELLRKNKEVEMDIDSIFGAETFEARTTRKGGMMRPTTTVRDGAFIYTHKKDGIPMDYDNQKVRKLGKDLRKQGVPLKIKTKNAETFDVEFNEWAEQEMMSHGKDISFKDWAEDEGMKHGDVPITEWAQHEDESHDARYGAESFEDFKRKMVGDGAVAGDVGYMEALEEFYEDYLEDFERITDEFCPEPETFEEFQERVLKNDYENLSAEDWGGDPKGKLATALRKAREKAKKPQKPLKIEKLDAEEWWGEINNEYDTHRGHSVKQNVGGFADEIWGTRDGEELFIFSQIPDYYTGTMYQKYPAHMKETYRESFLESLEQNKKMAKKQLMAEIEENIGKGIWTIEPYMEWFSRNEKWFLDNTWWGKTEGSIRKKTLIGSDAYYQKNWKEIEKTIDRHPIQQGPSFDKPNESGWVATTTLTDLEKPLDFVLKMSAETSGQWEIGEQLEEAQMNAEFLYYYVLNEKGESPANFNTLEEAQAYVANSSEPLEIYERRSRDDEAYKMDKKMNAEGKKKKKLSGQLSDPFDELSLDSGDWKGIVAGFGVGLLALFGYSKLRK